MKIQNFVRNGYNRFQIDSKIDFGILPSIKVDSEGQKDERHKVF